MTWTLVGQDGVTFTDGGGAGHSYSYPAGAPAAGSLDILCVNSDVTVSTPSSGGASWTLGPTFVGNQGAYLWYRIATGGEDASTTITTSANNPTQLAWSRWQGAQAADVNAVAHVDALNNTTTPAVSTGTLTAAGELVIAFAALHGIPGPLPASPSWSSGYVNLTTSMYGSGTDAHAPGAFVGYDNNAGTASESPNVSWANAAHDQYILVQTFTMLPQPSAPPAVLYSMRMMP